MNVETVVGFGHILQLGVGIAYSDIIGEVNGIYGSKL